MLEEEGQLGECPMCGRLRPLHWDDDRGEEICEDCMDPQHIPNEPVDGGMDDFLHLEEELR